MVGSEISCNIAAQLKRITMAQFDVDLVKREYSYATVRIEAETNVEAQRIAQENSETYKYRKQKHLTCYSSGAVTRVRKSKKAI